jgi:membrane protease YdiL (CAAX protease family)
MVLYALLMGGVVAMLLAVQKISGLPFEQTYMFDADFSFEELPQWLMVITAIISGVVFPIFNAPVEELQYRGYAQSRLIAASGSVWLGICIPALGFGLQHAAFAYTLSATPAFAVGFFLWGIGAGIIAYRQKRLAPLIIAHFISNLSFGIVPLFFMLRGV